MYNTENACHIEVHIFVFPNVSNGKWRHLDLWYVYWHIIHHNTTKQNVPCQWQHAVNAEQQLSPSQVAAVILNEAHNPQVFMHLSIAIKETLA